MLALLLLACTHAPLLDGPVDLPPTEETDAPGSPEPRVLSADCALEANPLRVGCVVELAGEGHATLTLSSPDAPTRVFETRRPGRTHDLLGWGLRPSTPYTWQIGGHSGTITTGRLPDALAALEVQVSGEPFGFDAVLQPLECGGFHFWVMFDGEGQVVWFGPNPNYRQQLDGYDWSQADRTILSTGGPTLVEIDLRGAPVLELARGQDYPGTLHHDVARWNGYTYLLHEKQVNGVDVDGVHVFHGETLLGTFRLEDWFEVESSGPTPFDDWSHANTVKVTDRGEIVMSALYFDTVLGIDGDPSSPTFLDLLWHAAGSDQGLPGPTYVAAEGPGEGFARQHNTSRDGDHLWMFDNTGDGVRSRAARYVMDHDAGEVRLDAEWYVDGHCPTQGGAVPIDGGVLVTCTASRRVAAYREGEALPDWTLEAGCGGWVGNQLNRGVPVRVE